MEGVEERKGGVERPKGGVKGELQYFIRGHLTLCLFDGYEVKSGSWVFSTPPQLPLNSPYEVKPPKL